MIYELIAVEKGHFYVCGDCKMAENVYQTLKSIIQEQSGMSSTQSDNFMLGLRVCIHYFFDLKDWKHRKLEIYFYFIFFRISTLSEVKLVRSFSFSFSFYFLQLNYLTRITKKISMKLGATKKKNLDTYLFEFRICHKMTSKITQARDFLKLPPIIKFKFLVQILSIQL